MPDSRNSQDRTGPHRRLQEGGLAVQGGDLPRPGELRLATAVPPVPVPGLSSSRVVLVVEVNPAAAFVLAMLTSNQTEMADDNDVSLPNEEPGLPFPLVFETNLVGAVWFSQLGPPIGGIRDDRLAAILRLRSGLPDPQILPYQGLPLEGEQDPRWSFHLEELTVLRALSASCTSSLLAHVDDEAAAEPAAAAQASSAGERPTLRSLLERSSVARIVEALVRGYDPGPWSLDDLTAWTGLPRSSVRDAVAQLRAHGLLVGDPHDPSMVRINADRPCVIGVSLRRDELIGVVANLLATEVDTLPTRHRPLVSTEVDVVVESVRSLVEELLAASAVGRDGILGLGVELSGHINGRDGEVIFSPDLRSSDDYWRNVNLAERLREATGLETVVENDANALALHQQWYGRDIDSDDFAVVLIGWKGVGCGLIVNGALTHGRHGIAGEIGHIAMEPSGGPACRCQNQGCLETIVSPHGICEAIGRETGARPKNIDAAAKLVEQGDETAVRIFERAGQTLGRGLSILLNLVNPSHVILLGPPQLTDQQHTGDSADLFIHDLEKAVEAYSFSFAAWRYKLNIQTLDAELGSKAAAAALLHRLVARPTSGRGW